MKCSQNKLMEKYTVDDCQFPCFRNKSQCRGWAL